MPEPVSFVDLDRLEGREDTTDWVTVDAERLAAFTRGTFLDPETIDLSVSGAHPAGAELVDGFLILGLLAYFGHASPLIEDPDVYMLNYGTERVRFTNPVVVGDALRLHRRIDAVERRSPTRTLVRQSGRLELRGADKPAMVASWLILYVDGRAEQ